MIYVLITISEICMSISQNGGKCEECLCSRHSTCHADTGACHCYEGFSGEWCDSCLSGLLTYPDCKNCSCSSQGTRDGCTECQCKVGIWFSRQFGSSVINLTPLPSSKFSLPGIYDDICIMTSHSRVQWKVSTATSVNQGTLV